MRAWEELVLKPMMGHPGSGEPIPEERLLALERQLGTELPDDYRRLLLRANGGDPEPAFFPRPDQERLCWITYFVTVDEQLARRERGESLEGPYATLVFAMDRDGRHLPPAYLPIALAYDFAPVVLVIRGDRRGEVSIIDWDIINFEEMDHDPTHEEVERARVFLSPTFSDFVASLRADE